MSKILLFGDLHLHPHKRSSERLQDCLDCLEWIFQTATDREIKTIIFLGDLFHDRQKIDVLTYQKTFEIFEKHLSDVPFNLYLLLVNHDLWHFNKWDVSSVNPLRAINGVEVIDRPSTLLVGPNHDRHPISFLPYTKDPIQTIKDVEKSRDELLSTDHQYEKSKRIICSHIAIDGAEWNTKFQTFSEVMIEHDGDMVKVNSDIFNNWDKAFLGHYHAAQRLDSVVEYVGSPLQLSFGEVDQKKCILIYDLKSGEKEYVENTFSPKHFILTESQLNSHDLNGQFVRVTVEDISSSTVVDIQKNLTDLGAKSVRIQQSPKEDEHFIKDAKAILYKDDEMLKTYLEQVNPENLNKEKLLRIGKTICEKGQNEES